MIIFNKYIVDKSSDSLRITRARGIYDAKFDQIKSSLTAFFIDIYNLFALVIRELIIRALINFTSVSN